MVQRGLYNFRKSTKIARPPNTIFYPPNPLSISVPVTRRAVPGKFSRVVTSACGAGAFGSFWHSRLETANLSHLNHLSPFPGQPCASGRGGRACPFAVVVIILLVRHGRALMRFPLPDQGARERKEPGPRKSQPDENARTSASCLR